MLEVICAALLEHIGSERQSFATILLALRTLLTLTEHNYGVYHQKRYVSVFVFTCLLFALTAMHQTIPAVPIPPYPHPLRPRELLGTHLLLLLFLMEIPHGGDQRDFEMPSLLGSPTKLIQEKLRHREGLYLRQYSSTLSLYNSLRVHFIYWPVGVVDQLITVKLSYESVRSKS